MRMCLGLTLIGLLTNSGAPTECSGVLRDRPGGDFDVGPAHLTGIEQITYLIFVRRLDAIGSIGELKAGRTADAS